ncbi:type II CRISPR-associated endonuclease Cas1 [Putridiphycobacter roseus]|uniref:CRISPR-associated endonuclease Cas1 n=1 Tax=Putridiphycobacter roseus TaxID=2219161 RepID=A0A2W1N2F0_9FLAO|nr:type II CRISPR-associated endonuclease Cas1 [Putridiphycobacter roseus]PZE17151.1 type II CRISPR-associated endonuclease Cas1 [Putridiphycobacter roseus]
MIKRTIYIGTPAYLSIKHQQMVIRDVESDAIKGKIPIEDIGLLMLDHWQITITHLLIIKLQGNNTCIISCDEQHLPFAAMLPFTGHTEHSERLKYQINASEPLKKQLWKQTVEAKISQQMLLLKKIGQPYEKMVEYMFAIKSGDTTNMEGKAAQFYWKHIFNNFTRLPDGESPNNALNYGYAILRAMVARALVSSGLNTTLGIFHRNKYNAYCLADDIMEPYRPYVDALVLEILKTEPIPAELTTQLKAKLLSIATVDVQIMQKTRPMMVAITSTTASFVKCLMGESRLIAYPILY